MPPANKSNKLTTYNVISPLRVDDKTKLVPGDIIDMAASDAGELIEAGVLQDPKQTVVAGADSAE